MGGRGHQQSGQWGPGGGRSVVEEQGTCQHWRKDGAWTHWRRRAITESNVTRVNVQHTRIYYTMEEMSGKVVGLCVVMADPGWDLAETRFLLVLNRFVIPFIKYL